MKNKSKTKIEKQLRKKNNPVLVKTIIAAKKKPKWMSVARMISGPRRKRTNVNLSEISKEANEGDVVVVPGKVLSQGELDKKVKITALGFSELAKKKIKESGSNFTGIADEIKSNPEAKGIKIIR